MVGRTPTKEEIEGKRIKVLFWPNHDAEKGWFDPPTTLTASRPTTRAIVIDFFIVMVLLGAAFLCFTKARRRMRAKAGPIPKGPGTWPASAGLVGVMTLLLWPLFLLIWRCATSASWKWRKITKDIPTHRRLSIFSSLQTESMNTLRRRRCCPLSFTSSG